MSLKVSATGSSYPILEAGAYPAICYAVIDIGKQYSPAFGNSSDKVIIMWELPGEKIEVDGVEKPRAISETYTASLNEKSNLRRMLDNWRGRAFTEDELQGFDLSGILGVPCLLNVIHATKKKDGSAFAKIGSVSKIPKGMAAPQAYNEPVLFDLDADDAMDNIIKLPEWVQNRIRESETYKMMRSPDASTEGDFTVIDESEDLPF